MNKVHYLVTMTVLLVSTVLFSAFVFVPTAIPYQVVNVQAQEPVETIEDVPEEIVEETLPTLSDLLALEIDTTKAIQATVSNRDLPNGWNGKKIYFKYTYIGEYSNEAQKKLDDLLLGEYKWQKQLDANGDVVMGGIILAKDGTYQLHTHNTFTKGERFFLLGDLLDRYHTQNELVGTRIQIGELILESVWERDTNILENNTVPYADLIVSTCLERNGDRRLISGWNIVRE